MEHLVGVSAILADGASAGEDEHSVVDRCVDIARRITVAEILGQRPTIVFSGLQGAGKSTAVAMLYDLPAGVLPQDEGRGERIPILICERDGVSGPEFSVRRFSRVVGATATTVQHLTQDEFYARARTPDRNDCILEMSLPTRHFGGGDAAILLLPGIEKRGTPWDALAQYCHQHGAVCAYAVDRKVLAGSENQKLLEDAVRAYGIDRMVILLTKSDEGEADSKRIWERLVDLLKLAPEHQKRVIRTGTGDLRESWVKEFALQLSDTVPASPSLRREQLDSLYSLVKEELGDLITDIEESLQVARDRRAVREGTDIKPIVAVIKATADRLRPQYEKMLKALLEEHARVVTTPKLEEIWKRGLVAKVKGVIFGSDLKETVEAQRALDDAWRSPALAAGHVRVLGAIAAGELGLAPPSTDSTRSLALVIGDPPTKLTAAAIADVESLTRGDGPPDIQTLKASLELLPAAALEMVRLVCVVGTMDPGARDGGRVAQVMGDLGSAAAGQKRLFGLLGAMLVVDAASDGKIDSLVNLAHALGGAGSAAAAGGAAAGAAGATGGAAATGAAVGAVSTPVVVAAIGLAVVIGAGVMYKSVLDDEFARAGRLVAAVNSLVNATQAKGMERFDDLMRTLQDLIVRALERRLHHDAEFGRLVRVSLALADAREHRQRFVDVVNAARTRPT